MNLDDRFIEAAANTARQRDEWKARAEKAERDLTAAQARERELRTTLVTLAFEAQGHDETCWCGTAIERALSAPQDTSTLRALCLEVAVAVHENEGHPVALTDIVDAVLKGAE